MLVIGIARRQVARHGQRVDIAGQARHCVPQTVLVERRHLFAKDVVAPFHVGDLGGADMPVQAVVPHHAGVVADENAADAASQSFQGGVRGQRRGHGRSIHLWPGVAGQSIQRRLDADGKILVGGEGLVRRRHRSGRGVE